MSEAEYWEDEYCESVLVEDDNLQHECWLPKGHEGPHVCAYDCGEEW